MQFPPYPVMQFNDSRIGQNPVFFFFLVSKRTNLLQTAVAHSDLSGSGRNTSELNGVTVGQSIHGVEANVEASTAVVNSQDVNGLAAVCELPAGAAVGGVPASDGLDTTNVWEARDLALGLPVVSGDEAVDAVGARDDG